MTTKRNPTVVDVLKRMKSLLRRGWAQGTLARGRSGRPVAPRSPLAVSFCLMGAEKRARTELGVGYEYLTENLLLQCLPLTAYGIVSFNDAKDRKKSEVLAVIGCAIKKAGEAK